MNRLLVVFLILIVAFSAYAGRLSSELLILIDTYQEAKNGVLPLHIDKYREKGGFVDLIVNMEYLDDGLSKYLLKTYPGREYIGILRLPLSDVKNVVYNPSIKYATVSRKIRKHMDAVRIDINVDEIYNYYGQDTVQGKDVIIGIIDTGIDGSHSDFRTFSGGTRILYLWDQTSDERSVNVPYGIEYTKDDIERNLSVATDEDGHGTHVAGISSGNGRMSGGKYSGIATASDIIFVKTDFSQIGILDGIEYIFKKAKQMGKPAVVNLSLGTLVGSHDGKDIESKILSQIFDFYGRNGNIVVISAGNSGYNKQHYSNNISPLPSSAILKVSSNSSVSQDDIIVDFWINYGVSPRVLVTSPNGQTTGWIDFSDNLVTNVSFTDGDFSLAMTSNVINGDLNIKIQFRDSSVKKIKEGNWIISFRTSSGSSLVHGWIEYSDGIEAYFQNGDDYFTLNSLFAMDDVIMVSAYTTKNSFSTDKGYISINYLTNDNIAFFSSKGPTRDNRNKPDISAPGAVIFAPLSSQSSEKNYVDSTYNKYCASMGTSMAAPVISGVVALLLSINPRFTAREIIDYLKTYSDVSVYDTNGKLWDESWGWGKVNVKSIVGSLKQPETLVWFSGNVIRVDNNQKYTTINLRLKEGNDLVSVSVHDLDGNLIKDLGTFLVKSGLNQIHLEVDNRFRKGVYLVKVLGSRVSTTLKMVVIK
ncbi:MAG: S8 family serine peptidase [Brevinematales bacterium]|nr:S8 family serine peptidase [Brevinematales bacterium]